MDRARFALSRGLHGKSGTPGDQAFAGTARSLPLTGHRAKDRTPPTLRKHTQYTRLCVLSVESTLLRRSNLVAHLFAIISPFPSFRFSSLHAHSIPIGSGSPARSVFPCRSQSMSLDDPFTFPFHFPPLPHLQMSTFSHYPFFSFCSKCKSTRTFAAWT